MHGSSGDEEAFHDALAVSVRGRTCIQLSVWRDVGRIGAAETAVDRNLSYPGATIWLCLRPHPLVSLRCGRRIGWRGRLRSWRSWPGSVMRLMGALWRSSLRSIVRGCGG